MSSSFSRLAAVGGPVDVRWDELHANSDIDRNDLSCVLCCIGSMQFLAQRFIQW